MEAAGGGGLQLFVESNVSVDSALIRQLVDEVLTEHVALMLGNRDASETRPEPGPEEPKPNSAAHEEVREPPDHQSSFRMFRQFESAASVTGAASGSNTTTHPSSEPCPAPEQDPAPDHTHTLRNN